jgi:large subunit ribosomal protein L4
MKAAALRGALSDRARGGKVHVLASLVGGETPSTRAAIAALNQVGDAGKALVVVDRTDVVSWKSVRNVPGVHVIAPDQLNTYDVLVNDDIVFTQAALAAFLEHAGVSAGSVGLSKKGASA